ncbi:MAG: hypothetical protein JWQ07_4350 [Ramlibacter sp.]|nr:hypothetical protein [Ramlibacter sp.]
MTSNRGNDRKPARESPSPATTKARRVALRKPVPRRADDEGDGGAPASAHGENFLCEFRSPPPEDRAG